MKNHVVFDALLAGCMADVHGFATMHLLSQTGNWSNEWILSTHRVWHVTTSSYCEGDYTRLNHSRYLRFSTHVRIIGATQFCIQECVSNFPLDTHKLRKRCCVLTCTYCYAIQVQSFSLIALLPFVCHLKAFSRMVPEWSLEYTLACVTESKTHLVLRSKFRSVLTALEKLLVLRFNK